MKIVRTETLISVGECAASTDWANTREAIYVAIRSVDWPTGTGSFTLYPESGKKRGEGNGVKPIKIGLRRELEAQGWAFESKSALPAVVRPGPLDALLTTAAGAVAVEWETGNISSSHRALNKLVLGLMDGYYAAGVLVVPSRAMAAFLTDRIGTLAELTPYLKVWKAHATSLETGILEIVEVEHDALSRDVPKIPKGTDGRASG